MPRRTSFHRLWHRWRDRRCARLILVDEDGHRMEYVHMPEEPTAWRREGRDAISGYIALCHLAETFIEARSEARRHG